MDFAEYMKPWLRLIYGGSTEETKLGGGVISGNKDVVIPEREATKRGGTDYGPDGPSDEGFESKPGAGEEDEDWLRTLFDDFVEQLSGKEDFIGSDITFEVFKTHFEAFKDATSTFMVTSFVAKMAGVFGVAETTLAPVAKSLITVGLLAKAGYGEAIRQGEEGGGITGAWKTVTDEQKSALMRKEDMQAGFMGASLAYDTNPNSADTDWTLDGALDSFHTKQGWKQVARNRDDPPSITGLKAASVVRGQIGGQTAHSLFFNERTGQLMVSYRGTTNISEALIDAKSVTKVEQLDENGESMGMVGKGFLDDYLASRDTLQRSINQLAEELASRDPPVRIQGVIASGHSLGGAKSFLFCNDFNHGIHVPGFDGKPTNVSLGSPMVGDGDFVRHVRGNTDQIYRIADRNDPVVSGMGAVNVGRGTAEGLLGETLTDWADNAFESSGYYFHAGQPIYLDPKTGGPQDVDYTGTDPDSVGDFGVLSAHNRGSYWEGAKFWLGEDDPSTTVQDGSTVTTSNMSYADWVSPDQQRWNEEHGDDTERGPSSSVPPVDATEVDPQLDLDDSEPEGEPEGDDDAAEDTDYLDVADDGVAGTLAIDQNIVRERKRERKRQWEGGFEGTDDEEHSTFVSKRQRRGLLTLPFPRIADEYESSGDVSALAPFKGGYIPIRGTSGLVSKRWYPVAQVVKTMNRG